MFWALFTFEIRIAESQNRPARSEMLVKLHTGAKLWRLSFHWRFLLFAAVNIIQFVMIRQLATIRVSMNTIRLCSVGNRVTEGLQ
jgi:hypothetical protein